ncbi:hypothetical protein A9Q99_10325 [Gammaproteobacteria bacterium 45_16_T64]|nr:hypothetical protein A9Q99_10325 [Gammaproteobacteria bacterium 45_16_T64]
MTNINRALHRATQFWCNSHQQRFVKATQDVQTVQKNALQRILSKSGDAIAHTGSSLSPTMNWKDFANDIPISNYDSWKPWIASDRDNGLQALTSSPTERFQPTSGSTSAVKWIPYSQDFLAEINCALMAWIGDIYQSTPGINRGYHYWSVSWIPTSLRGDVDENVNDDLKVLPWWKRWIAGQYMAVPDTVAQAKSSEDTLFASLAWLLSRRDLTMLSVWSPTFALSLFEQIIEHRDELIDVLHRGHWLDRSASLEKTRCPSSASTAALLKSLGNTVDTEFLNRLWPDLALISSWDTASSKIWADKLQHLFPNAAFQGKGLWATEGVVTIPFGDRYPLSVNSHYYEFLDLSSNDVVPAWKLEKGMEVSPLLTTGSGFLRYKLNDKLVVDGFLNQCPCFEFRGRLDGTDLAGEKISAETSQSIITQFTKEFSVTPVSLVAIPGNHWQQVVPNDSRGCYVLLCEPSHNQMPNERVLSTALEQELQKNFHYQLARELKQIAPAKIVISNNASDFYMYRCLQRGMAKGNIKIEPLVLWNTGLPDAFVYALRQQCQSVPLLSPEDVVTL